MGMKKADDEAGNNVMHVFAAGTSCVDVSTMGSQLGLMGKSSRALAVWMAQIKHVGPVSKLQRNFAQLNHLRACRLSMLGIQHHFFDDENMPRL